MTSFLLDLLIKPDSFFQKRVTDKVNLGIPVLIILIGAIIDALHLIPMNSLNMKMLGSIGLGTEFTVLLNLIVIIGFFAGFVIFFIKWAVITGIFYIISVVFKGTGSFSRSLEVIAYGTLPQIIADFINLIVAFVYIPLIAIPQINPDFKQNPAMIAQAMFHDPALVQYTLITMTVSILFLLWSAYCWIYGMKHARQISLQDSAICVGVPVILYILYLIGMTFFIYGLYS